MKIAITHNLRLTDSEEEAEFDLPSTLEAIEQALCKTGHEVARIEVSGPASHLCARLEAFSPDLIFNIAEGRRGRAREAFYPALFEELGYPYTGSDAYALALTLDKALTKLVLRAHGIESPIGRVMTPREYADMSKIEGSLGVPIPAIVKPNFEGSSKGISDESVARDWKSLRAIVQRMLEQYPQGVLIEEYIPGQDLTVPYVEGLGQDGLLTPAGYAFPEGVRSKYNLYDYRLKNSDSAKSVQVRCPPDLPRDVLQRVRTMSRTAVRALGLRDVARLDFRIADDGRIYFLEVNALPSLEPGTAIFRAAEREGISYDGTIAAILSNAAVRWKLVPSEVARQKIKPQEKLRIGFTFNLKRPGAKAAFDADAEYDSPLTINAITESLEALGHEVVQLEANSDLPARLKESKVDLVFNIAEGLSGRNREAQVPALCELCGIPYTGSDAATLSLALDKALAKKLLKQAGVLTPEFQVFTTGREKLAPQLHRRFPLIVKPIAEGSSKGIIGKSVVDNEAELRKTVKELIDRYKQPALVEEFISGREFTVGLLGDRRPRVLPPMEILFKASADQRPVYDYEVKHKPDWEQYVAFQCPAKLTQKELRAVERAALETFQALDCRDVGRVDLRMDSAGNVYVLELNPLPGLTPDFSDLVLIAKAAAVDYRTLISEILAGGLKRLREKRRGPPVGQPGRAGNGHGNGHPGRPGASSETPADAAPSTRSDTADASAPAEQAPTSRPRRTRVRPPRGTAARTS
ncbi:MAG: ATP-grasp domain-containing protein [Polyangia bacterium]